MIKIMKDTTKKYYVTCPKCNSEFICNEHDLSYGVCPVCGQLVRDGKKEELTDYTYNIYLKEK